MGTARLPSFAKEGDRAKRGRGGSKVAKPPYRCAAQRSLLNGCASRKSIRRLRAVDTTRARFARPPLLQKASERRGVGTANETTPRISHNVGKPFRIVHSSRIVNANWTGIARVRTPGGTIRTAEIHWFEAHGVGRRGMRIKTFLD